MPSKQRKKRIASRIPLVNTETGQEIEISIFEPPPEEPRDMRPTLLKAARNCWKSISQQNQASDALTKLNGEGCHWVLLLAMVERWCMYPHSELKVIHNELAKILRKLSRKLTKFHSTVTKWEQDIDKINSEIDTWLHVDVASHTPHLAAYKAAIWVAHLEALPSSGKPEIEKQSLVYLYHLIRLATGRAHYKELTDIIQARLQDLGSNKVIDEGTIQKTIKRFKQEQPAKYLELKYGARAGLKVAPFSKYELPSLKH